MSDVARKLEEPASNPEVAGSNPAVARPTRAEHLQRCKDRAMEYVDRGQYNEAVTSMLSDLSKHPETERSVQMGTMLSMIVVMNPCRREAERFVLGFN